MTVPAAGEFRVGTSNTADRFLGLHCPECGEWSSAYGDTIRDLITAATDHTRLRHPMSVHAVTLVR